MASIGSDLFERLVRPHMPALFRAAYRCAGNTEDAKDLVQDVCIAACGYLEQLEAGPGNSRRHFEALGETERPEQVAPERAAAGPVGSGALEGVLLAADPARLDAYLAAVREHGEVDGTPCFSSRGAAAASRAGGLARARRNERLPRRIPPVVGPFRPAAYRAVSRTSVPRGSRRATTFGTRACGFSSPRGP